MCLTVIQEPLEQGSSTFFRPRTPKLMERWSRDPLLYILYKIVFYIKLDRSCSVLVSSGLNRLSANHGEPVSQHVTCGLVIGTAAIGAGPPLCVQEVWRDRSRLVS